MHKLTNNRRRWGVGALLTGLLLGIAALTQPYVWLRLPRASVSVDGETTSLASVYRSPNGQLLVWIDEPGAGVYIADPSTGEIHEPAFESLFEDIPEQNHFLVAPRFALIMDDRYRANWNRHYDDDAPTLGAVILPGHIEFTEQYLLRRSSDYRSRRVVVTF